MSVDGQADKFTIIFAAGIGALLGGLFTLFATWLKGRCDLKATKIKLYHKDSLEGHKEVFMLAQKICNSCFPLSERKRNYFIALIESYYINRIERNYVYFSSEITSILDRFNEMYQCIRRYELQEFNQDVEEFLEEELFDKATMLANIVKKECKRYQL